MKEKPHLESRVSRGTSRAFFRAIGKTKTQTARNDFPLHAARVSSPPAAAAAAAAAIDAALRLSAGVSARARARRHCGSAASLSFRQPATPFYNEPRTNLSNGRGLQISRDIRFHHAAPECVRDEHGEKSLKKGGSGGGFRRGWCRSYFLAASLFSGSHWAAAAARRTLQQPSSSASLPKRTGPHSSHD